MNKVAINQNNVIIQRKSGLKCLPFPHKIDTKWVDENQKSNNGFTALRKFLNNLLKFNHKQPAKWHRLDSPLGYYLKSQYNQLYSKYSYLDNHHMGH